MTVLEIVKGMKPNDQIRCVTGKEYRIDFTIYACGKKGKVFEWWDGLRRTGRGTAEEAAAALEHFLKGR